MSSKPFELRVVADKSTDYGLALFRVPARSDRLDGNSSPWHVVVEIRGTPMKAVIDQILTTIKQAGYRPSDLSRSRRAPFQLPEELGLRLGLLMLAVKPLRKPTRMAEISEQIQRMTSEEAYYWFSKSTDRRAGRRCQKAMRILLARE